MNGTQLMDAIVDAARVLGYTCAHFRPAQTSKGWRTAVSYDGKGFPDLVLVRPRTSSALSPARVIFAEVKGKGDRLRVEQELWLDVLRHSSSRIDDTQVLVQTFVWTPAEWTSGAIERVLR